MITLMKIQVPLVYNEKNYLHLIGAEYYVSSKGLVKKKERKNNTLMLSKGEKHT
jgi:hypothetical protein